MKVLMIRPTEHPVEMNIKNDLRTLYQELDCDLITVAYPWAEPVALVTDDEGMLRNKQMCRYIKELNQPICGNFLLCGITNGPEGGDFADLRDDLMEKYRKRFWNPEWILDLGVASYITHFKPNAEQKQ